MAHSCCYRPEWLAFKKIESWANTAHCGLLPFALLPLSSFSIWNLFFFPFLMFLNFPLVVSNPVLENFTTGCPGANVSHLNLPYMLCLVVHNVKWGGGCSSLYGIMLWSVFLKIVPVKEGSCLGWHWWLWKHKYEALCCCLAKFPKFPPQVRASYRMQGYI